MTISDEQVRAALVEAGSVKAAAEALGVSRKTIGRRAARLGLSPGSRVIGLVGQRFGRLIVIGRGPNTPTGQARWRCHCDCGREAISPSQSLREGHTRSCGCLVSERARSLGRRTHGMSRRPEYRSWSAMKTRCTQVRAAGYADYGGRGITIDLRWAASFEAFFADMGERPDGTTLDRIDNDGNYEPGNCRWATARAQARNRRDNKLLTSGGTTQTVAEWAESLGIPLPRIYRRLRRGASDEKALRA